MVLEQRGAAAGGFHFIRAEVYSIRQGTAVAGGTGDRTTNVGLIRAIIGIIINRAKIKAVTAKTVPGSGLNGAAAPTIALAPGNGISLAGAGVAIINADAAGNAVDGKRKNALGNVTGEKLKRGIQGAVRVCGWGGIGVALERAAAAGLDDGKADAGRWGGINNKVNGSAARNRRGGGSEGVSR